MKRLGSRVNLIPVIAKADTLTPHDLAIFKQNVNDKKKNSFVYLKQHNRSVKQSRIIILTPIAVLLKVKTKRSRSVIKTLLMLLHLPSSAPPNLFKRPMEDR